MTTDTPAVPDPQTTPAHESYERDMVRPDTEILGYVAPSTLSDIVPYLFYTTMHRRGASAILVTAGYDISSYHHVANYEQNPALRQAADIAVTRGATAVVIGGSVFGMRADHDQLLQAELRLGEQLGVPVRFEAAMLQERFLDTEVRACWVVHRFGDIEAEGLADLFPGCEIRGVTALGGAPGDNIRIPLGTRDQRLSRALPQIRDDDVDVVVLLGGTWPEVLHLGDLAGSVGRPVLNNVTCTMDYFERVVAAL